MNIIDGDSGRFRVSAGKGAVTVDDDPQQLYVEIKRAFEHADDGRVVITRPRALKMPVTPTQEA